jgi:hypothetical protein
MNDIPADWHYCYEIMEFELVLMFIAMLLSYYSVSSVDWAVQGHEKGSARRKTSIE